jgi:hypothetical protein
MKLLTAVKFMVVAVMGLVILFSNSEEEAKQEEGIR